VRVSRSATRIARGAKEAVSPNTNVSLVRGTLVALPTVRVIDRHQRATTFDLATIVGGKRAVVPVVALNMDLPIIKVGDDVTVLGHVRRRFFRIGARTQSVTELMVEYIVSGNKTARLEKLYTALTSRVRETRNATASRDDD